MSANLHPGVGTADVGRRLEMSGGGVDGDQVFCAQDLRNGSFVRTTGVLSTLIFVLFFYL